MTTQNYLNVPGDLMKVAPFWAYEDYSDWAKRMAKTTSLQDLHNQYAQLEKARERLANNHLKAIQKTSSMTGNSQSRAQTRSIMTMNYEKLRAVSDAIELHENYPECCKA